MALMACFLFVAVVLTWVMFSSRESMLGPACLIFWALSGAQAFTLSDVVWDMYYIAGFAMLLGMTTFSGFAGYALREKRDAIGDEEMARGEGHYLDEPDGKPGDNQWMKDRGGSSESKDSGEDDFVVPSAKEKRAREEAIVGRNSKRRRKSEFDY